jgi:predicted porin
MKKTLVALASLAALGTSFAQMTIYGNLDQTVVNSTQGGKSATFTKSNSNASSYWGIASKEDMGGGLSASFDLRSEITLMTGQAASSTTAVTNSASQTSTTAATLGNITAAADAPGFFNRGAYIKLEQAGIGALTIGRQADLWWAAQGEVNTTTGTNGGSANLTAMQSNTISSGSMTSKVNGTASPAAITNYAGAASSSGTAINPTNMGTTYAYMGGFALSTPTIAGFSGAYQFGIPKMSYNDAGSANNGAAWAIRYDGMGLSVRLANTYKNDYDGNKAFSEDVIGASYTMGQWKVALVNNKMKLTGKAAVPNANGTTSTGGGVFYTMSSALTLNAAYGILKDDVDANNKFTQTSVNAVYKLSPRTSIYGGIANGKNEGKMLQSPIYSGVGTDTVAATVSAYFFGARHTF